MPQSSQMPNSDPDREPPKWSAEDLRSNPHQVPDKAARVESMFSSIAHRYDLNNRLHSLWRDQSWRRRVVQLAEIKPTDEALDMACGTGDLTLMLAEAGAKHVIGMDFTQAMLDRAEIKASRQSLEGTVRFRSGDAMKIDLPDQSMDVITIAFGIRNVARPELALQEFARVAKPGGRLLILEFSTPKNPIMSLVNRVWSQGVMPVTAGLISGDRTGAYRYLPKSVATFASPPALAAAVEEAGWSVVQQVGLTGGICTITMAVRPENQFETGC